MNILKSSGKYLYVIPFLIFGFGHLTNAEQMATLIPWYIPWPTFWIYFTGLSMCAAAVAMLMNKKAKLAAVLLGIMLVLFALILHLPNMIDHSDRMAFPMFLKDIALAGAAFFYGANNSN